MKWISFSLIILLVLNSSLFGIKIATQAFFMTGVCMVYVFQSFYFQPICVLFKVHLVKKTYLGPPFWKSRLLSSLHLMICIPTDMRETWVQSLDREDPLEEGMAAHSSTPAWRIPMDRGAWWATVHGVTKSRTRLSGWAHISSLLIRFGLSQPSCCWSSVHSNLLLTSLFSSSSPVFFWIENCLQFCVISTNDIFCYISLCYSSVAALRITRCALDLAPFTWIVIPLRVKGRTLQTYNSPLLSLCCCPHEFYFCIWFKPSIHCRYCFKQPVDF